MWKEGTIGVPTKDGKTVIVHYWVKAYEEPSEYGINEGRISKLTIKVGGKVTANYDRGWDIEIDEDDEATQVAFQILMMEHN